MKYDIAQKIANANTKPTIVLAEGHEYEVNNSKSCALMIHALSEDSDKKGSSNVEFVDKMIELAMGKEALEYILSQDYSMSSYNLIVEIIQQALVGDVPTTGTRGAKKK